MSDIQCVAVDGVAPTFVAVMIRGVMAHRYMKQTGIEFDEAVAAAIATWDTDWESDPAPRSFENAIEAVDDDLQHWEE